MESEEVMANRLRSVSAHKSIISERRGYGHPQRIRTTGRETRSRVAHNSKNSLLCQRETVLRNQTMTKPD
jgi:hypothetical protein